MRNFNIIAPYKPTSSPGPFPQKLGGAGKGPGIGWSRVPYYTLKKPGCNKLALCEKLKLSVTSQNAILGDLLYLRKVLHDFLFVTDTDYCNFLLSSDFYEGESEW